MSFIANELGKRLASAVLSHFSSNICITLVQIKRFSEVQA